MTLETSAAISNKRQTAEEPVMSGEAGIETSIEEPMIKRQRPFTWSVVHVPKAAQKWLVDYHYNVL